ncbi:MAG: LCCL domain-containing protein [bacterium]
MWGTGVYTLDSSICRAAIHSGVNQDIGGLIELVIKEG